MAWITHAPAKVNLDLRMRGVRGDGYHLLTTVLQSIALADTLTLRARPGPFGIACDTAGVPADARNLAWKGAAAMAAHLGVALDGWELAVEKHVPAEAGLGGGSADAAAAARLIASAAGRSLDAAELAEVIRPLGADVAFFAWGGTMRGEGVGDVLTPLPDVPAASVLLVRPPFGVSTAQAYRWFDETSNAERRTLNADSGRRPDADIDRRLIDRECPSAYGELRQRPGRACGGTASRDQDHRRPVARRGRRPCGHVRQRFGVLRAVRPGGQSRRALGSGWPDGTRVWHTRLLSRAEYAERDRRPAGPREVRRTGVRTQRSAFGVRRSSPSACRVPPGRVRYRFAHLGGRVPGGPSPGADAADEQVASGAGGVRRHRELSNTGASLADTGAWPSGKARDFGSRIRRFESFRPSHIRTRHLDVRSTHSERGAPGCRTAWQRRNSGSSPAAHIRCWRRRLPSSCACRWAKPGSIASPTRRSRSRSTRTSAAWTCSSSSRPRGRSTRT